MSPKNRNLLLLTLAIVVVLSIVLSNGRSSDSDEASTASNSEGADDQSPDEGSPEVTPPTDPTTSAPTTTAPTTTTFPNLDGSEQIGEFVNSPEAVAYDMFGPAIGTEDTYQGGADGWGVPWPNHEAPIQNDGTDFRWLNGGSSSKWNVPGDERAIYARCKAVPAEGGVGPTDFVLQIRGMESYQRVDGEWSLHQTSDAEGMDGDWYDLANFFGDRTIDAELRPSSDDPMVYEVPWPETGEIFHFFMGKEDLPSPEIRKLFDPDFDPSRDAFFATAQLRIVAADGSDIDLDEVQLLGNCGLDFYRDETSTRRRDYDGPVPSAGHPRSKFVTSEWQAFNWYTLPGEPAQSDAEQTWQELRQQIIADPPPINR